MLNNNIACVFTCTRKYWGAKVYKSIQVCYKDEPMPCITTKLKFLSQQIHNLWGRQMRWWRWRMHKWRCRHVYNDKNLPTNNWRYIWAFPGCTRYSGQYKTVNKLVNKLKQPDVSFDLLFQKLMRLSKQGWFACCCEDTE